MLADKHSWKIQTNVSNQITQQDKSIYMHINLGIVGVNVERVMKIPFKEYEKINNPSYLKKLDTDDALIHKFRLLLHIFSS